MNATITGPDGQVWIVRDDDGRVNESPIIVPQDPDYAERRHQGKHRKGN